MADENSEDTANQHTNVNRRSLLGAIGAVGLGTLLSSRGSSARAAPTSTPSFVDWDRTFGGSGNDRIESIHATSDGKYVFAGTTASFESDHFDGWLAKVDSTGTEEWRRTFGDEDLYSFYDMVETADGGYALTGNTQVGANNSYPWMLKTDARGNEEWQRLYDDSRVLTESIAETSDGGFVLTGRGGGPIWVGKVGPSGNREWGKRIRVSSEERASHYPRDVIRTTDGRLVICGSGYVRDIQSDSFGWLVTLDEDGNYSTESFPGIRPFSFVQTADGGLLLGGNSVSPSYGDFQLLKIDKRGNEVWSRTFGGSRSELITDIIETDGGFILSGHTNSYDGNDTGYRGWVATTDSVGNVKWEAVLPNRSFLMAATRSADGGCVLGGFNRADYTEDGRLLKLEPLNRKPDFQIDYSPKWLPKNEPITFEASSATGFVRYEWEFDDGTVITTTGQPVTRTYAEGGKRRVTLRAVTREGWLEVVRETLVFPTELDVKIEVGDITPSLHSQGGPIRVRVIVSDTAESQKRIAVETLQLGEQADLEAGSGFSPVRIREDDADGDGDDDLLLDFEFSPDTLGDLAREVYLFGERVDGMPVIASSTIRVE